MIIIKNIGSLLGLLLGHIAVGAFVAIGLVIGLRLMGVDI